MSRSNSDKENKDNWGWYKLTREILKTLYSETNRPGDWHIFVGIKFKKFKVSKQWKKYVKVWYSELLALTLSQC